MKKYGSIGFRLSLSVSTVGFGQAAFVSLVPVVMEKLGQSALQIGTAGAAGALAFLAGSPIWGGAGDRWGQGRLLRRLGLGMLAGQAIFAILMLGGFSGSIWVFAALVLSRTVYGFAASGIVPTAQTWVARTATDAGRRGALGLISAGVSMGRLAGALPALLAVFSPVMSVLLFVASPLLLWLAPRGSAPAAIAADVRPARLTPLDRRMLPVMSIGFLLTLGFGQVQIVLGPMIGVRFDLDAVAATSVTGIALTLVALVMIAAQLLVVPRVGWSDRSGVVAGSLFVAAGMAGMASVGGYAASAIALAFAATGIALATPSYVAWLMHRVEEPEQGAAAGWLASIHVVAQSMGALVGGFVYTLWPFAPLLACAMLAIAAALVAAMSRQERT